MYAWCTDVKHGIVVRLAFFCPKREIQTLYLLGIDIYTLCSIILLYRSVSSLYAHSVLDCLLRLGGIFQNLCCDRSDC